MDLSTKAIVACNIFNEDGTLVHDWREHGPYQKFGITVEEEADTKETPGPEGAEGAD